ncbi:MAG: hypothetical protein ACPLXP_01600 [Microgenomates group bacterium]
MEKFKVLGVGKTETRVLLFVAFEKENFFRIATSKNGVDFGEFKNWGEIVRKDGQQELVANCQNFCLSKVEGIYFLTYNLKEKKKTFCCGALWSGFSHWQKVGEIVKTFHPAVLLSHNKYLLFWGEDKLKVSSSSDLVCWRTSRRPLLSPPKGSLLKVGTVFLDKEGIWVVYFLFPKKRDFFQLKAVCLSSSDPGKVLKKRKLPLLERKGVSPLGVVWFKGKLFVYWQEKRGKILVDKLDWVAIFSSPTLAKFVANPILAPRREKDWEAKAVFNSGVVCLGRKIHFLYRAVGRDDISVWGYASSKDGLGVGERSFAPVFSHFWFFGKKTPKRKTPSPVFYLSGPGEGGSEDPRITKIGNRLYVTYNVFDGVNWPRVGLTSIKVGDFLKKRWCWKKPVLISPPGEMHKNWVIFPQKIKGKYAILHSLSPRPAIDYRENLNFDGKTFIKSYYHGQSPDALWEKVVKGVGPPPLKTPLGWLVLYHGLDKDFWHYKMGAMILDYFCPEKILFRARAPILKPTEVYENQGLKPGIVYSCGATIWDDKLFVYYGGADTVLCLAWAPLEEFLGKLKSGGEPKLVVSQKPVSLPYD